MPQVKKSNSAKQNVFIEYRGIATDWCIKRLKSIGAPLHLVIILHKMRTCLPFLKSKIEKNLKSGVA